MSLRSPLGRVLGSGSAKKGVHHWWAQRLTSVALVPLTIWFVISLLGLPSLDHTTVIGWMREDSTALALIVLILAATWHSQLGASVVVEDYVHVSTVKTMTLIALTFSHVLLAAAGVFAVLKVALGQVQ